MGWGLPPLSPTLPASHGPLMICGFLGTVIGVERAVALGTPVGFIFPALTGLGALAVLGGLTELAGPLLIAAGSAGLVGLSVSLVRRQPALHHATLALGAVAWLAGNALWLAGWPVSRLVPWWIGFLVLTIAGERLELSRVLLLSRASRIAFTLIVAAFLCGAAVAAASPEIGERIAGLAMLALALWLLVNDVARRTVRQEGLTRFIAACMLSGYAWLGAGGILIAVQAGRLVGGPPYDAALHAVFLGFVFSMIFGHAPIILPAVLKVAVPFRPSFYAHLVLLHASLALRVAGDLSGWWAGRRWGGLLNVLVLLLFVGATARAVRSAASAPARGG